MSSTGAPDVAGAFGGGFTGDGAGVSCDPGGAGETGGTGGAGALGARTGDDDTPGVAGGTGAAGAPGGVWARAAGPQAQETPATSTSALAATTLRIERPVLSA